MRYGIFSDVHANLEALEVVLKAIGQKGVDQLLCAGDLVGYGADPIACLEHLRQHQVSPVCGNHDCVVTGRMPMDWFNDAARDAAEWTQEKLPSQEKAYLSELPTVWKDDSVTLVHASLCDPESFQYVLDPQSAAESMALQETPVTFIGHTHVPGIFQEVSGQVIFSRDSRLELKPQQKYLVNVGSVGQPRDGDPRAAFVLYDTETGVLEICRVPYEVAQAQKKIRQTGLPSFLADRLEMGF